MFDFIPLALGLLFIVFVLWKLQRSKGLDELEADIAASSINDPDKAKTYLAKRLGGKRTRLKGESLTDFEIFWMQWRLNRGLPACIDCEIGELKSGPSGGACFNTKCSNTNCGSKFNVGLFGGPAYIERITDRSPDKPIEMASFGPHR